METGYSVSEVMVRDVITISPEASLLECAKKMADKKIGCLVVTASTEVIGIITEQDLARKVLAREINAKTTKVKEIMSSNIKTISPENDLYSAVQVMGNNEIKHLPVVIGRKLAGIITAKDIIQIQPGLIELLRFNTSTNRSESNDNDDDIDDILLD